MGSESVVNLRKMGLFVMVFFLLFSPVLTSAEGLQI